MIGIRELGLYLIKCNKMINKYFTLCLQCTLLFVCSCGNPISRNYTGRYMLDIENSDLGIYKDSTQYHQLILTINEDSTYEFGKDIPFIIESYGRYGCEIKKGLINHKYVSCFLMYESTKRKNVFDGLYSDNEIYFINPTPKKGAQYVNKLCFKRI